ncbi:toxin-antitoxin system YwqK family antitoxin [Paraburkholderia jirisanensis]
MAQAQQQRMQNVSVVRSDARVDGTTLDGELHGTTRVQADGVVIAVLNYARGVLHGPATTMHADGSRSAQLNYVNGKLEGKAIYYLPDGAVQREAHYAQGLLHGECKTWLPDGTLLEHAVYRQGKLQGMQQRFHPNRKLAERQVFNAGKPVEPAHRYASDGRPLDKDGKPISRWKQWWQSVSGQADAAPS